MLPWQRHIRQRTYQKVEVCVVNLLTAIFGDQRIEGFRGKVNETEVSKTVFSHLNRDHRAHLVSSNRDWFAYNTNILTFFIRTRGGDYNSSSARPCGGNNVIGWHNYQFSSSHCGPEKPLNKGKPFLSYIICKVKGPAMETLKYFYGSVERWGLGSLKPYHRFDLFLLLPQFCERGRFHACRGWSFRNLLLVGTNE